MPVKPRGHRGTPPRLRAAYITQHERRRREAGLTATALGRAVGLSGSHYVSKIERRVKKASPRYQAHVSRILQTGVEVLFDPEGWAR